MIKNWEEWLIPHKTVLLFRRSWTGCGIGQERNVMKSSNREHQVLLPGRHNPLHTSTKGLDSLGCSSGGKDLGDLVATKLTMSQHCTLVAKAQQEPRCQQAAAFSMGAVPMGTWNGKIPLHSTCVLQHPTAGNAHSSACHAVWQVSLSLLSWTEHKALWPAAAQGCWTPGRAGLMHLHTPVWHYSVLGAGVCREAGCFLSTLFTLVPLPSTQKYNHWPRQIHTVHCPFYCT